MNRRGLALPTTLLLLALLGVLAGVVIASSRVRRLAGERALATARLDAALRGELERVVAHWSGLEAETLGQGAIVGVAVQSLPHGGRLTDSLLRLGTHAFLLLGRGEQRSAAGVDLARARLGYHVRLVGPVPPRQAAIASAGPVVLDDLSRVEGQEVPQGASWAAGCPPPGGPVAGVTGPHPVVDCPGGCVHGSPPMLVDSTLTPPTATSFGPVSLNDLDAAADHRVTGAVAGPGPVLAGATCDRTDPGNWGDPGPAAGPCSRWFPIIAVADGAVISGGMGQGVLLGQGRLTLTGALRFHGLVIARGALRMSQQVEIHGTVVAGDSVLLEDQVAVRWSYCAATMAGGGSARPVRGRGRTILPGI